MIAVTGVDVIVIVDGIAETSVNNEISVTRETEEMTAALINVVIDGQEFDPLDQIVAVNSLQSQ
jgi:uncharacterized protein with von Willebrand factor type A (vWA) domain